MSQEKPRSGPVKCPECDNWVPTNKDKCRCGWKVEKDELDGGLPEPIERTMRIPSAKNQTRAPLRPVVLAVKPVISFLKPEPKPKLTIELWFSGVMVAGSTCQIMAKLQNQTNQVMKDVEVSLQSPGLESTVLQKVQPLNPNQIVPILFKNVRVAKSGLHALQCSLEFRVAKGLEKLAGARSIWINSAPEIGGGVRTERFALNSDAGKIQDGPVTPQLLINQLGAFQLEIGTKTLQDLLKFPLPQAYNPVALCQPPAIPEAYLLAAEAGSTLKLKPDDKKNRALHLVGRKHFKIGRASQKSNEENWSDLVVWFLGGDEAESKEKTRSLGRLHVVATASDTGIILKNFKTTNVTCLDGRSLEGDAVPFDEKSGLLSLSVNNYDLQMTRFPALEGDRLNIRNIDDWKGREEKESPVRGALAFRPVEGELPLHDAVWMLSSASFGSDAAANPVVIPKLAPVQGCFFFAHGTFWLQSLVANQKIKINGKPVLSEHVYPLSSRDSLVLGDISYHLEVCKD